MDAERPRPRLERFFRALVGARIPILVVYGLLAPAAVVLALRVPSDGAIDRLVVASDPDYVATRAFQKVFPEGEHVVLLVEADDPFAPDVVSRVAALEERLAAVPGVQPFS